ncbi:MAG TPA: hypothetical protein VMU15_17170 [Anaeromyxobacter sp.]|nr:hypothetical protein [Anaeromyxobacter sp.]
MPEGEHTIIGRIPRERLNQIASRKLSAMGVAVRLGPDRETLEGELVFSGRVVHPATGQSIARARFLVDGHDRLRFPEAPLSSLGAVNFYEHDRVASLEQALAIGLARRGAALQDVAARMRALRLEAAVDPERLAVRAVLKTATHAFEILGTPEGVRVSRVAPVGGRPFEVAADFPPLSLAEHASVTDLEIFLVNGVPRMSGPAATPPRPVQPPPGGGELRAMPPPRNAATLGALVAAFGPESILAPNVAVELVQEFEASNTRYRFVATREMGTSFRGRVIGPSGDVWADRFELEGFPGVQRVVALALELPEDRAAGAGAAPAGEEVPGHLLPHAGEVWVMNVVVEESGQDEVRYVGTDIDGRPYGAARVLKRADFEAVFTRERGGWCLLVHIDQLQDGNVIYRQLDRNRQPIGAPRRMATAILVANFVPEAAAY